jgi:hypothetical protein
MSMPYHRYDGEHDGFFCVLGMVANWGKVIPGNLGWRAEKAYPIKLFVPYEIAFTHALPLEETYGVEVEMRNWTSEPAVEVPF